jgi:PP-loop superfamily ATP-utilizing enzyme
MKQILKSYQLKTIIERIKYSYVINRYVTNGVIVETTNTTATNVSRPTGKGINSSNRVIDIEQENVTKLVDQLLDRTKQLMTTKITNVNDRSPQQQQEQQQQSVVDDISTEEERFNSHHHQYHHTIAYSGGIDSSLVAALVYQISLDLNNNNNDSASSSSLNHNHYYYETHNVQAVLGISPAVSQEQIQLAEQVAAHIGIPLTMIPTYEGLDETYIANNGQACFACKSELYTKLIHHTIANYQHQIDHDNNDQSNNNNNINSDYSQTMIDSKTKQQQHQYCHYYKLYNGTNADDCLDSTRVGLIAASKYNVLSPLQYTTKSNVRTIAKHLNLPNWNVASNPCLRSRLALGIPATQQHLQRIEHAERFIRQQLLLLIQQQRRQQQQIECSTSGIHIPQYTVETNLRVRLLAQQKACLEIDDIFVDYVQEFYNQNQNEWDHVLLKELQFNSFIIRPFRSGSVAKPTVTSSSSSLLPQSTVVSSSLKN